MGFVVSSLTNYVNEQNKNLIAAVQFEAETASMASIQTGVDRKSTRLNSSHTDISRMPSSA